MSESSNPTPGTSSARTSASSSARRRKRRFVVLDVVGTGSEEFLTEVQETLSSPLFHVISQSEIGEGEEEGAADAGAWVKKADEIAETRYQALLDERLQALEEATPAPPEGEDETQAAAPPAPTRADVEKKVAEEVAEITGAAERIIVVVNHVREEEQVKAAATARALPCLFVSVQTQENDPDAPLDFPLAKLWTTALSIDTDQYGDCDFLELSTIDSDGSSPKDAAAKLKDSIVAAVEDLAAFHEWLSGTPVVKIPGTPKTAETNRLLNYYQASLYGVPSCLIDVPVIVNALVESVATVESPVPRGDPVEMTRQRSRHSLSRALMKLSASRSSSPTSMVRATTPFSVNQPSSPVSVHSASKQDDTPTIVLPSADSLAPSNVMSGGTWPDLGSEAWNMPNGNDGSLLHHARLSLNLYVDLPLLRLPVLREPMKFLDLALGDGFMDAKTQAHVADMRKRLGRSPFSGNDGPDHVLRLVAQEPRKIGIAEAARAVLARVATPVVFGPKGLPLEAEWSDEERQANLSELLTFTEFAPDTLLRTRGIRMMEEALFQLDLARRAQVLREANKEMSLREKLEIHRWNFSSWCYHEGLPSHAFGQVLLDLLEQEPEVVKTYDPLADTVTLALYTPTPRMRLAHSTEDFSKSLNERPQFRLWREQRSRTQHSSSNADDVEVEDVENEELEEDETAESAAAAGVAHEAQTPTPKQSLEPPAVIFDLGKEASQLKIPQRSVHTLLPSDHAVVKIQQWPREGVASLRVHKDGHSFGLAPPSRGGITEASDAMYYRRRSSQSSAIDPEGTDEGAAAKGEGAASSDVGAAKEGDEEEQGQEGKEEEEQESSRRKKSATAGKRKPWWKFVANFIGDGREALQPTGAPASLVMTATTPPPGKKDGKGFVNAEYGIDDVRGLVLDVSSNGFIWQRHRNIPAVVPASEDGIAEGAKDKDSTDGKVQLLSDHSGHFSNATWPEDVVESSRGVVGAKGTVVRRLPSGVRHVLYADGTSKWWAPHCSGHEVLREYTVEEEEEKEVPLTEEDIAAWQEEAKTKEEAGEEVGEMPATKTVKETVTRTALEEGVGVWYTSYPDGTNTAVAEFPDGSTMEETLAASRVFTTTDPNSGAAIEVRYEVCPVPAKLLLPKGHRRLRGVGCGARYGEALSVTEKWLWSGIVPMEKENFTEVEDRERYLRSKRYKAYETAYRDWQLEAALLQGGLWSGAAGDPALLPPSKSMYEKGSAATTARGVSSRSMHELRSARDVSTEKWRQGDLHATPKAWEPAWSKVQVEDLSDTQPGDKPGFLVRVAILEDPPAPEEQEDGKDAHGQPTERSAEEDDKLWFQLQEYPAYPPGEPLPGHGFPFSPARIAMVTQQDKVRTCIHGDGTVITQLPPRWVRKPRDPGTEGDSKFQEGPRVIVAKPEYATVEVDVETQYESALHAAGERVATTKSGMRTRFLVTSPDGCVIAADYNNDITASFNGQLRIHRPDGIVILGRDGGEIEYRPAASRVTPGVVGVGVGDIAGEDSEDEDGVGHDDDSTGRSTPLSARSEEDAQAGVYMFSLEHGRMELADTEENRFNVELRHRGTAPPHIDIDLAGTVEKAQEAAVLPRVNHPKPPRLFRIHRPTTLHPFAQTPNTIPNEDGGVDELQTRQLQLFRGVFESLVHAEEVISPERFEVLRKQRMREKRRARREDEELTPPEGAFSPISRSTAMVSKGFAMSMPAAVDVHEALAITGISDAAFTPDLSQQILWDQPAKMHVITNQLVLLPLSQSLASRSRTSSSSDTLPQWQQVGTAAGRVGVMCIKGRMEVRASGRGWILPRVGKAKGVAVDWRDVEETYGGVLISETRAHEERLRKLVEEQEKEVEDVKRVTFTGSPTRRLGQGSRSRSRSRSRSPKGRSASPGFGDVDDETIEHLQRRSRRVAVLPELITGPVSTLEAPIRLVAWREITEKPQLDDVERETLAKAEAECEAWRKHVSSELNRFAVHDPRTEAQLMREASLAKQARRLRKAAKRKARAAQRKKMTEANDGGKFPDRASEAGDIHHQYEQQQKEGEEDMEMRRLHLGNAARAANADDESKTRRSETNQATARALATGRTSETRSNLGVRLPVGGPSIRQKQMNDAQRRAARERARKLLKSVSSEPEKVPAMQGEEEKEEEEEGANLGSTSPPAYIGTAEAFYPAEEPPMAGTGLAAVRGHRSRSRGEDSGAGGGRSTLRFVPPSLRFGTLPVGCECILNLSITNNGRECRIEPIAQEEEGVKANLVIADVEPSLILPPGSTEAIQVRVVTRSEGAIAKPLRLRTSSGVAVVPVSAKVVHLTDWKPANAGAGVQIIQR